ncbi:hypothetical protein KC318_g16287 [Hortaea werneckii]|nr:hypothetical protein KC334_g15434 [Hortaea werneckii]KAI6952548.1 hypothetical protein KC355_g13955 [Hortaea werneckii]KAI7650648.1 hypothetical protein KC318_g16287 [Hortaea werneckii]
MDGCLDPDSDSDSSLYEDNSNRLEEAFQNNPSFQTFLQSISHTIETSSLGLNFDFENLTVSTHTGQKILQDITGSIPRGSCWGIMGPSGAGKSTLVNVLMGQTKADSGTKIKINGLEKTTTGEYRKVIGHVPQADTLVPELTVRENILHSARCRLPAQWRDKAIQTHVDALIGCLQLSHVQDSQVGYVSRPGISGGQRKRVSIGIELAAAPMAIFLDEPTSGLDATSAASIMRLLKGISRLGVTIIAIVHQPREQIFYGFGQVLLLTQGRMVYAGATAGMEEYFEGMGFQFPLRANPADTLMDIITGNGAQYAIGGGAATSRGSQVDHLIDMWKTKGQDPTPHDRQPHLLLDGPLTPPKPLPRLPSNPNSTNPSHPTPNPPHPHQPRRNPPGPNPLHPVPNPANPNPHPWDANLRTPLQHPSRHTHRPHRLSLTGPLIPRDPTPALLPPRVRSRLHFDPTTRSPSGDEYRSQCLSTRVLGPRVRTGSREAGAESGTFGGCGVYGETDRSAAAAGGE